MATAPYGVRLLVGAAATAIEETRKLPQTILMYPMTLASQVASLVMKVQQDVAVLVIKGDETLETFFPPKDEQAEWATFDDDYRRLLDEFLDGPFAEELVTAQVEAWVAQIADATTEAAAAHDDAVSVRKWTGAVDELLAALDHARSVARKPRDGPGA